MENSRVLSRKTLIINILSTVFATVTGLGIAFVLTPFLVSKLGKDVYSFYPMANNLASYFTIIVTALNALSSRFITYYLVKNDEKKAKGYFTSVFYGNCVLAAIFVIPMLILIVFLNNILSIPPGYALEIRILFSLVFVSLLINMLANVFSCSTLVANRLDYKSGQQIAISIVRVSLYLFLFAFFSPRIIFVGLVVVVESVVNLLISLFFSRKLLPDFKIKKEFFSFKLVKEVIVAGIWNSINSLGGNLLTGTMIVMTNILLNSSDAGVISIVLTLVNLCATLITMMVGVFYPRQTRKFASNGTKGLMEETRLSQYLTGFFISVPIIGLLVFGQNFYSLWVPNEDSALLYRISIICLIPYFFQTAMWSLTQTFSVVNKIKVPALFAIGFGALNIVVAFLLSLFIRNNIYIIPIVSSVLNVAYCLLFVPVYVAKTNKVSLASIYKPIVAVALSGFVCCLLFLKLKNSMPLNGWLPFIVCCGVSGVFGYLFMLILFYLLRTIRTLKKY